MGNAGNQGGNAGNVANAGNQGGYAVFHYPAFMGSSPTIRNKFFVYQVDEFSFKEMRTWD